MDKIYLHRHEEKYNKYLNEITEKQEMIQIIKQEKQNEENEYVYINYKIAGKEMFAFVLTLGDSVIGIAALDKIDFENKNCSFKAGIFQEYIDLISEEQMNQCIREILKFQKNYLGIRRAYGIMNRKSQFINSVSYVFYEEGRNINKDKIYYGYIDKENNDI